MNYGYGQSNSGMWIFGGLMMLGMVALIGVAVWAVLTVRHRPHPAGGVHDGGVNDHDAISDARGRAKVKQILDERFARGELTSEDYAERLRTLGVVMPR